MQFLSCQKIQFLQNKQTLPAGNFYGTEPNASTLASYSTINVEIINAFVLSINVQMMKIHNTYMWNLKLKKNKISIVSWSIVRKMYDVEVRGTIQVWILT